MILSILIFIKHMIFMAIESCKYSINKNQADLSQVWIRK